MKASYLSTLAPCGAFVDLFGIMGSGSHLTRVPAPAPILERLRDKPVQRRDLPEIETTFPSKFFPEIILPLRDTLTTQSPYVETLETL